jgi:photosystem II stability/assembly factor-like uncharacterized protein
MSNTVTTLISACLSIGLCTLAACTTTPPSHAAPRSHSKPRNHSTPPAALPVARRLAGKVGPTSATFVSASTGWLLGVALCSGPACPLEMLTTTDGGRRWSLATPPPTSALSAGSRPDSVSKVVFANARDGWAFDPGLWATHDGGASWRQVDTRGSEVTSLAASDGHAVAVLSPCRPFSTCGSFQVDTVAVSGNRWRPVRGAAGRGRAAAVTTSGTTAYLSVASAGITGRRSGCPCAAAAPRLLAGPVSGAARWRALPVPCPQFDLLALGASRRGTLVLSCGGEPGAGNQLKRAYLSANGGRTWRRLANPPFPGYLGQVSVTSAGTIFVSGERSDVYISTDSGRSWHVSPGLSRADIADGLAATMITNREGFVLQATTHFSQIWLTRDGGRTWQPVTTR